MNESHIPSPATAFKDGWRECRQSCSSPSFIDSPQDLDRCIVASDTSFSDSNDDDSRSPVTARFSEMPRVARAGSIPCFEQNPAEASYLAVSSHGRDLEKEVIFSEENNNTCVLPISSLARQGVASPENSTSETMATSSSPMTLPIKLPLKEVRTLPSSLAVSLPLSVRLNDSTASFGLPFSAPPDHSGIPALISYSVQTDECSLPVVPLYFAEPNETSAPAISVHSGPPGPGEPVTPVLLPYSEQADNESLTTARQQLSTLSDESTALTIAAGVTSVPNPPLPRLSSPLQYLEQLSPISTSSSTDTANSGDEVDEDEAIPGFTSMSFFAPTSAGMSLMCDRFVDETPSCGMIRGTPLSYKPLGESYFVQNRRTRITSPAPESSLVWNALNSLCTNPTTLLPSQCHSSSSTGRFSEQIVECSWGSALTDFETANSELVGGMDSSETVSSHQNVMSNIESDTYNSRLTDYDNDDDNRGLMMIADAACLIRQAESLPDAGSSRPPPPSGLQISKDLVGGIVLHFNIFLSNYFFV